MFRIRDDHVNRTGLQPVHRLDGPFARLDLVAVECCLATEGVVRSALSVQ